LEGYEEKYRKEAGKCRSGNVHTIVIRLYKKIKVNRIKSAIRNSKSAMRTQEGFRKNAGRRQVRQY
jgi:hypothetical protein